MVIQLNYQQLLGILEKRITRHFVEIDNVILDRVLHKKLTNNIVNDKILTVD